MKPKSRSFKGFAIPNFWKGSLALKGHQFPYFTSQIKWTVSKECRTVVYVKNCRPSRNSSCVCLQKDFHGHGSGSYKIKAGDDHLPQIAGAGFFITTSPNNT